MVNKGDYAKNLRESGFPQTSKYINAISKEVRFLSKKYNMASDYEDMLQLALIEAVRLEPVFDIKKGNTFLSFIRKPIRQIMQKLYGFSRSSTNSYNKIVKFMKAYETEHSVLPTTDIIAKALNMTEWKLKSIYYGKPLKVSLEALGDDFALENAQTELSRSIQDALEILNDEDSKLITLLYLEEYSVEELSVIYSISVDDLNAKIVIILDTLKEAHDV